ncbi:MAG: TRAP transporter small permease [Aliihoeflea sp.]|uniref:TRAP transporter small permease n=1 Tax=Aliihoeflea sp. TaxID=2608088 RepID=UPI0040342D49
MASISRLLAKAAQLTAFLAGLAIAAMMIQVTADVAMRYLLGRPLSGTLTVVSYYYMVIAAFVPLALAEQKGGHISVEFVTELLPQRVQDHLAGLILIPTTLIGAVLTWRTFEAAMRAFQMGASQTNGSSSIPVWPAYFALPLGAGLMTLILLARFIAYVTGRTYEGDSK